MQVVYPGGSDRPDIWDASSFSRDICRKASNLETRTALELSVECKFLVLVAANLLVLLPENGCVTFE